MRRFAGAVFFYGLWPVAAAAWAFARVEGIFREKLVPLPFELFGTIVAAGMFFFALSASILAVGVWKKRKGKIDEAKKSGSSGAPGPRSVDAGVGG